MSKWYVCVFVCFTTKAIHLEAVSDMTTKCFMAAFNRFVGHRGYPAQVFSDNGRNFVGAAKAIAQDYHPWGDCGKLVSRALNPI